jgi:drug/metabolite transporter (DMT)-like permease
LNSGVGPARSALLGALLVIASALCFAIMPVIAKVAYRQGVEPFGLLAWRFVVAAAMLWILLWWRHRQLAVELPDRRQVGGLLALGGVLLAGEVSLYFFGLQHLTAGLAEVLLFLFPAWVVVIVAVRRRAWPSPVVIGCTLAAVVGAGLAVQGGIVGVSRDVLHGVALLVGASITFALYVVLSGRSAERYGSLPTTTMVITGGAGTFVVAALVTGSAGPSTALGYAMVIAIAVVSTVLSFGMLTAGLALLPATHVSVIATAEPVFAVVLGWQLLGETLVPGQLLGIALVVGSILVILGRDIASPVTPAGDRQPDASAAIQAPGVNRE